MAGNINQSTRKKQLILATLIGSAVAIAGGTIYYVNGINKLDDAETAVESVESNEKELEPDLTGSVSNTFEGSVGSQVISDAQAQNKESREALTQVMDKLTEIQNQLEEQKKENEELKKRVEDNEKNHLELISTVAEKNNAAVTPVDTMPDGVSAQRSPLNYDNYNTTPVQNGVIQLNSPNPVKGSFERKVYSKKDNSSSSRFYVPSGAFSDAIILEGADANASVTAQQNSVTPMQFKLNGKLHLPANQKNTKLAGCFVTAGTYGDISSERAIVRTNRLSCVINGKHVDQEVKGHVAFYGKNGIKGEPVMRNGKIVVRAVASGALGGIGRAISAVGDTQAGLGATRTVGGNEVLREALGGGTTTAANKLADYYIQRAEQYHPVIPIGSANRVEVVFTEGFWVEFVEDQDESENKSAKTPEEAIQPLRNGNPIPPELQNQLGEISKQSLSDFVTPNQPNQ